MSDKFLDKIEEQGRQKGIEKNRLESIKAVMESFKVTAREAMEALKNPADDQPRYLTVLHQKETR